ncbi:MAG: hypothetical protein Ct9H300mP19_14340 [Dehalococcoidia bacterium]|nr:MAG: hypothetical protein Ct9H300mP19_14340 [Dehalococcoidia bacterium]
MELGGIFDACSMGVIFWRPFTALLFAAAFLPSTAQLLIMITASLFLGFKGNELAWRGKKWQSVEHFNSFQRNGHHGVSDLVRQLAQF